MITDAAKHFIKELTAKTTKSEIEWKPLCELYSDTSGFPDFLNQSWEMLNCNEFKMLQRENSFFFFHNQGIISLMRIENYSGRDSSHYASYSIILQIRKNYPPESLCEGLFQDELEILYMAVLDYINRDISLPDDLYKFLNF